MQETDGVSFYDVNVLPYSKEEIFKALLAAIKLSDDIQTKEHMKAGLISLAHFQENIGDQTIKPFNQDLLNSDSRELLESIKSDEGQLNFKKYNEFVAKVNEDSAFYMDALSQLNQNQFSHSSFIESWKKGRIKVDVDRSKALRAANSNILPKRYRAAHIFWSTIWLLTIPLGIGLIFYKWWIGLLVLFVASPLIAKATKTSAMQFMIDHAVESEDFYNLAINEGIFRISEKPL